MAPIRGGRVRWDRMKRLTAAADCTYAVEDPEPLSRLVVTAVADAEGVDPTELPPLYSAVDPDALDSVFYPQLESADDPPPGEIQFSYHGHLVRVTAAGRVELVEE